MAETMGLWERTKNIFRVTYTLTFVMASLTGVVFALTIRSEFLIAFLVLLDVFLLALFVNFSNDYFDHVSGADSKRFFSEDKEFERGAREILGPKIYWAGNAFDLGYITASQGRIVMALLAAAAIVVSTPIVLYGGWIVIVLGVVAFFVSFFYTAPPLNLGARGLGEFDVFLSFFMMSFFSYFVIVQSFSVPMFVIALTVGIAVALMRLVDEMSGYEAHLKAGEKDICVRIGLENAAVLAVGLAGLIYIISSFLLLYSPAFLLLFLTAPLVFRMSGYLQNRSDRFRFVRPAPVVFMFAFSHMLLVIFSLIAQTFLTSL